MKIGSGKKGSEKKAINILKEYSAINTKSYRGARRRSQTKRDWNNSGDNIDDNSVWPEWPLTC